MRARPPSRSGGEPAAQGRGSSGSASEHILTGYDHLLFLLALLLRGGRLLSLLKIITAFTVAHSITLALAVLGVVTIPGRVIEPAIAASIVWVALENLLRRDAPSQRWLVSFVFGLVLESGLASATKGLGLPPGAGGGGPRLAWRRGSPGARGGGFGAAPPFAARRMGRRAWGGRDRPAGPLAVAPAARRGALPRLCGPSARSRLPIWWRV